MCVVEQNNLCCSRRGPLLCKHRPLGVGWVRAECRRCRGWNMIWMAHAEMGNITLEAYSTCPHALKIQGFITPQLWCICENFNVYCGGPSQCCDVCINITRPRCVFFFFFLLPLNSAWRIDNRGLICLPPPLRGSTAKQRVNCVSVFCGILSNLKDWGNQCFFHFRSGDAAFDNRPVAKWVVSLKVATKISIMGITSCILQSVIGPITAA